MTMWKKGNPSELLMRMQTGAATVENSMEFLPYCFNIMYKKLTRELPFDPAIPLLEIYPKSPKNTDSKEYIDPYVHSSSVYNSQVLKTA